METKPKANLRVISQSDEPFKDRTEAGRLLAEQLYYLSEQRTLVLGIARGGILVAQELAHRIQADLDVAVSRKIRDPDDQELGIGAIAEDGTVFLNEDLIQEYEVPKGYIDIEKAFQLVEARRQSKLYRNALPKTSLKDRIVIVTDDGLGTGVTMQSALWTARQTNPQKLIAAVPVAPEESLLKLLPYADEIICLRQPPDYYWVGHYYEEFHQVDDQELLRILEQEQQRRNAKLK
jgi:predicted phosphoribosyltransferase